MQFPPSAVSPSKRPTRSESVVFVVSVILVVSFCCVVSIGFVSSGVEGSEEQLRRRVVKQTARNLYIEIQPLCEGK